MLFLLLACSEYGINAPNDNAGGWPEPPPVSDDTGTSTVDDTDDSAGDTDPPVDSAPDEPVMDDPPTGGPPDIFMDDCPSDVTVTFSPSEIYVTSTRTAAAATLSTDVSGWFHVFDTTIAESGASQQNETGYVRISNAANPDGFPRWATCGDDWIVRDADNSGSRSDKIYVGTYWLESGDNAVALEHICPRVNAGECTSHMNNVSGHSCSDTGNPNSVHLVAEGLCLVRAR